MITLRRSGERHHERRSQRESWRTFDGPDRDDPLAEGFGQLVELDEIRLAPGASLARADRPGVELLTYVRSGALASNDPTGTARVVLAGEFQRRVAGRSARNTGTSAAPRETAHVFVIGLRPRVVGAEPGVQQQRFSAAQRRNELCLVASPDGRRGSLHLRLDAEVYAAILDPGWHVVHALGAGRSAWIHVLEGEIVYGAVHLTAGDGLGVVGERVVSLTAKGRTELLLLELEGAPAGLEEEPPEP